MASAIVLLVGIIIFSEITEAMALTLPTPPAGTPSEVTIDNGNKDVTLVYNTGFDLQGDVFRTDLGLDVSAFVGDVIKVVRLEFNQGEGHSSGNSTIHLYDQDLNFLASSNIVLVPSGAGSPFLVNYTFNDVIGSGNSIIFVATQYQVLGDKEIRLSTLDTGKALFRDTGFTFPNAPSTYTNDSIRSNNTAYWTEMDILTSGVGSLTPSQQQEIDTFNNAKNIGFTVIGILPVALFFALFAIFSGRIE